MEIEGDRLSHLMAAEGVAEIVPLGDLTIAKEVPVMTHLVQSPLDLLTNP